MWNNIGVEPVEVMLITIPKTIVSAVVPKPD
jgi:hypothetical protein